MLLAWLEFVCEASWLAAWFWGLLLIGLVWLRRHLQLRQADTEPILSPNDATPGQVDEPLPTLTVLVAGKDEEDNIGRCLEGLLAQDYAGLEVIAINDRSSDRTGAIMDAFAAQDPRSRALHVQTLPSGWMGKSHAMHQGVQHAGGEYLCFTDADCRFHDPHLLAAAVRFARRNDVEFLSVLPDLEAHTFWERVVQPPAGAIMVFWYPPDKVNNPRSPRAYANGAFMLMSRAAYDCMGGHEAVRSLLSEDMRLAERAKRLGVRLRVIRGGGMYSVRMYTGLRQIWAGWTRIFYSAFGTLPRLLVSVIFLSIFSLLPYLSLLLWPLAGPAGMGIAAAAVACVVAQQSVLWRFYKLSRTAPPWALTWPLGAAVCLAATFNAIPRHFGATTQWRGTVYGRSK